MLGLEDSVQRDIDSLACGCTANLACACPGAGGAALLGRAAADCRQLEQGDHQQVRGE